MRRVRPRPAPRSQLCRTRARAAPAAIGRLATLAPSWSRMRLALTRHARRQLPSSDRDAPPRERRRRPADPPADQACPVQHSNRPESRRRAVAEARGRPGYSSGRRKQSSQAGAGTLAARPLELNAPQPSTSPSVQTVARRTVTRYPHSASRTTLVSRAHRRGPRPAVSPTEDADRVCRLSRWIARATDRVRSSWTHRPDWPECSWHLQPTFSTPSADELAGVAVICRRPTRVSSRPRCARRLRTRQVDRASPRSRSRSRCARRRRRRTVRSTAGDPRRRSFFASAGLGGRVTISRTPIRDSFQPAGEPRYANTSCTHTP